MLAGASLSQDGPGELMVALAKCNSSHGASVLAMPKERSSWPSAPLANSRLIRTWSGVVTDGLAGQRPGAHDPRRIADRAHGLDPPHRAHQHGQAMQTVDAVVDQRTDPLTIEDRRVAGVLAPGGRTPDPRGGPPPGSGARTGLTRRSRPTTGTGASPPRLARTAAPGRGRGLFYQPIRLRQRAGQRLLRIDVDSGLQARLADRCMGRRRAQVDHRVET